VRLESASLPDGAAIEAGMSEEKNLSGSDELALEPFVFSQPIEEKPVLKVFEREQGVVAPEPPRGNSRPETRSKKERSR
jgi:hypothetical protein